MRAVHVMSALLLYSLAIPTLRFNATDNTRGSGSRRLGLEEPPMDLAPDIAKFVRSRPTTECAQCGERIYIPEWSECVDSCRVRHVWQCDACGTSFQTTVRLAAA
jgi:hypothetical protein